MNLFAAALSTAILPVGETENHFRYIPDEQASGVNPRCSDSCFSALETFSMYPLTRSCEVLALSGAR